MLTIVPCYHHHWQSVIRQQNNDWQAVVIGNKSRPSKSPTLTISDPRHHPWQSVVYWCHHQQCMILLQHRNRSWQSSSMAISDTSESASSSILATLHPYSLGTTGVFTGSSRQGPPSTADLPTQCAWNRRPGWPAELHGSLTAACTDSQPSRQPECQPSRQ
jgi:hypothetical protein